MVHREPGSESESEIAAAGREQASGAAVGIGKEIASSAAEQAKNVSDDAKLQAADVLQEARLRLEVATAEQKARSVRALVALADAFDKMTEPTEAHSAAAAIVQRAARGVRELSDYLERRAPAELLEDIRSLARRRPIAFLAGAALAGVVGQRLVRAALASGEGEEATKSELGGRGPHTGSESYGNSAQAHVEPPGSVSP